jgi:hypothetical protein
MSFSLFTSRVPSFALALAALAIAGLWFAQRPRGDLTAAVTGEGSGSDETLKDFRSRCGAAGVLVCEGFDKPETFFTPTFPATGVYPGSDNTIQIYQDKEIKASGAGSLRFPIKANDGTGDSVRDDNFLLNFQRTFAENATFYVQFRYRVDDAYVKTDWEKPENGGSSPKIADFAFHSSSCGQTEITTNNRNGSAMPMMYTSCGGRGFFVNTGTTEWNAASPPYQWQNGYYNCAYPDMPAGKGGCFRMPPNNWMTFYYKIQLGSWGKPNSHITAWIAGEGKPLQTFVDVSNMVINADAPGFDAIWFNVYMTGFSAKAKNPAANAWLDEVIVSAQPIPSPAANPEPSDKKSRR